MSRRDCFRFGASTGRQYSHCIHHNYIHRHRINHSDHYQYCNGYRDGFTHTNIQPHTYDLPYTFYSSNPNIHTLSNPYIYGDLYTLADQYQHANVHTLTN